MSARILKRSLIMPVAILSFISCQRVVDKGEKVITGVREKVARKSADMADKVFPTFDAYHPDTRANKKRFQEFLQVALTPDIHGIYCHSDAIGIDAAYQFAFHCNPETAQRIITSHQLKPDVTNRDFAFGIQDDFDWWDKTKIAKLKLYWREPNETYFQYFWYDKAEQKAYYFDFDM